MATARRQALTSAQLRKKYKFVVPVPKASTTSYNPARPVGGLVTHQLQHLQFAMQALPGWHHAGMKAADVKTEGDAAAFVAQATAALHQGNQPSTAAKRTKPVKAAKAPKTARRRQSPSPRRPKKTPAGRRRKPGRRA